MLDVHPPEHGIHGAKDFFVHLVTITVGLLIALGLENAAEAVHHRNQRVESQKILRQEIQDNQGKLIEIVKSTAITRQNMIRTLQYLDDRRQGKPGDPSGISFSFTEEPLESTGWKTTLATGVVSYMDVSEVQTYSGAYQEQQLFEEAEERALEHIERLDSYLAENPDPTKLNSQDLAEAMPDVRNVIADLSAMQDVGRGTLEAYAKALKK